MHRQLAASALSALVAGLLTFVAGVSPAAEPDRWPQFRGPGGLADATDTGIPVTWDLEHSLLWTAAIEGRAHSSPAIWGSGWFSPPPSRATSSRGRRAPVHRNNGKP